MLFLWHTDTEDRPFEEVKLRCVSGASAVGTYPLMSGDTILAVTNAENLILTYLPLGFDN